MKAVKTILFVENDPVSLTMYQNRLQREGFYVETAQDGLTALRILSQSTPDLVVLDLMLPRFNGGEVFKIMRTDRRLANLPVVIFSNAAMTEWPQDVNVGTTRCLPKSESTFPILLQTIQEMLAAAPANSAPVVRTETLPGKSESRNGTYEATPTPIAPAATASSATNSATKSRMEFLAGALSEVPKLRELCLAYIKAPAAESSQQYLTTLQQRIQFLNTSASQNGCTRIALLANVFGTLLSEIMAKPSWATTSVLQTMAQAVDCLRLLLNSGETNTTESSAKAKVLAVDDDPVCNHVIVTTLRRANFDPITIESPTAALELLRNGQFDLVLLDVNMPEMTGFQLCEKLRRIPHCKSIPVVFVTAFNNFDNRKQSVLSGGNDFITKPISPLELALKVTIHMLKAQLQRASAPPVEVGAEIPDAAKETLPAAASFPLRNGGVESPKPVVLPTEARTAEPELAATETPPPAAEPPANSEETPPPAAPIAAPQLENLTMAESLSASALTSTTESHTTDVERTEDPVTAPASVEQETVNAPEGELQPVASIAAPQLDPSLAESLALSSAFTPTAELPAGNLEPDNSSAALADAPSQEATENLIPAASIPVDMFQRDPVANVLPASALAPSTESHTGDSENAAVESTATTETAPETTPSTADAPTEANQPIAQTEPLRLALASPTETAAVETPAPAIESQAKTESADAPAVSQLDFESSPVIFPEIPSQPTPSNPNSPFEQSTAVEAPASERASVTPPVEPETALTDTAKASNAEASDRQADAAAEAATSSKAATESPAAEVEKTVSEEVQPTKPLAADSTKSEPEDSATALETPSLPTIDDEDLEAITPTFSDSEPAPAKVPQPAVQPDLLSSPAVAAPLFSSTPLPFENQKSSMQTQNNQTAFDKIVVEVAKIIFGDNNVTELNLRLVRAALERSNIHQMVNGPTNVSC